jgi:hypothetical protein
MSLRRARRVRTVKEDPTNVNVDLFWSSIYNVLMSSTLSLGF